MAGTLSPSAKQYFWNIVTGAPLAGGFVRTVSAGGVSPGNDVDTYQDQALTVKNKNPIQLNGAGYCTIYLTPGQSYKFIVTDANGQTVWTQDGIQAVPTSASSLDIIVTAGENIAAEAAIYISDGSGGKNTGQAYNASATNTYSSSLAGVTGLALAAIASGAQGTVRIAGQLTVVQTLTSGAKYFLAATAGAITVTAPANVRYLGQADGVNSIIIGGDTPYLVSPLVTGGVPFPATQIPSTDPNTQDDYEEGVWGPTDTSGAALVITVNSAPYIKQGQQVTAWFDITYPATADGSGAQFGGLPYTSNAIGGNAYGGPIYVSTYANAISANVATTSKNIKLFTLANTQLTNANLSATTSRGFVTYRAGT